MTVTIIHSVNLFDGWKVRPNATVAFDSNTGKITSVSESNGSESDSSDVNKIDGTGLTLLPGLIDAHVHVHALHLPPGASHSSVLRQPLQCGVTTICDMHSDPPTVHKFKAAISDETKQARTTNSQIELADLKSSLYGATIAGGWPKPIVLGHDPSPELEQIVSTWPSVTPETAAEFVHNHKANGADYIKLMQENCCSMALPTNSIPSATPELQSSVIKAAHDEGLLVVAHATALENTEIVLKAGADGLTHTFIDQMPTDDIIPMYKANNAFVIPTLTVLASLTGELQDLRERYAGIAKEMGVVDDFTHQNATEFIGLKAETAYVRYAYETIRLFKRHGVDVVAGTDSAAGLKGTAIGPSLWLELDLYVKECGYTPVEALKSATSVTADKFRFGDRGVVESGRRADLLLVKGDPTKDLSALYAKDGIVGVWREGLRAVQ